MYRGRVGARRRAETTGICEGSGISDLSSEWLTDKIISVLKGTGELDNKHMIINNKLLAYRVMGVCDYFMPGDRGHPF